MLDVNCSYDLKIPVSVAVYPLSICDAQKWLQNKRPPRVTSLSSSSVQGKSLYHSLAQKRAVHFWHMKFDINSLTSSNYLYVPESWS